MTDSCVDGIYHHSILVWNVFVLSLIISLFLSFCMSLFLSFFLYSFLAFVFAFCLSFFLFFSCLGCARFPLDRKWCGFELSRPSPSFFSEPGNADC